MSMTTMFLFNLHGSPMVVLTLGIFSSLVLFTFYVRAMFYLILSNIAVYSCHHLEAWAFVMSDRKAVDADGGTMEWIWVEHSEWKQ